jgi:hypothetical protein
MMFSLANPEDRKYYMRIPVISDISSGVAGKVGITWPMGTRGWLPGSMLRMAQRAHAPCCTRPFCITALNLKILHKSELVIEGGKFDNTLDGLRVL